MANVDKELHNPEATAGNLIKERTSSKAKRGLRGAAGGIYVGPVLSNAATDHMRDTTNDSHATGAAGGGVEDTSGYRESDTYTMGTDVATATVRPSGRTMYRSNGTGASGSVPGYPAQRAGQRAAAAAGTSLTAEGSAADFIDKRSNIHGDGGVALGSAGRGTRVTSASGTVTVAKSGKTKVATAPRIARAAIVTGDPNAGEVQLVDGTSGVIHADLHADDITGGANGLAGCVIYVFAQQTDTDEDSDLVRKGDFDTVTEGAVTGLSGLTAATYNVYAAFKSADGNVGPWSAKATLTVT